MLDASAGAPTAPPATYSEGQDRHPKLAVRATSASRQKATFVGLFATSEQSRDHAQDADSKKADLIIAGEGFSEFAGRRGNLVSIKSRLEVKVLDKAGNVVAVDKQTTAEVDLAEQVAGKKSLQEASAKIAERILPKLIKK